MKKTFYLPLLATGLFIIPSGTYAFVPLICDLCTIGAVAWLAISRYFGVDDSVVGVWIGAVLVALVVMTNAWLEKKDIKFRFRDTSVALTYVWFMVASLYYAGVIGIHRNTFFGSTSIFADKILISSIVGWLVLAGGSFLYRFLKSKNGGRAHFPFEKVAIPLGMLVLTSGVFYFVTLR